MQKNAPKFVFVLLALAGVIFWRSQYPSVVASGDISSVTMGDHPAAQPQVEQAIPPNIDAQDPIGATPTSTQIATSTGSMAPSTTTNPPGLDDAESLVADLTTGSSFLKVNADERWPLASISKLMTAVVAIDRLNLDQKIGITDQMTAVDPSEQILRVGDTYTVSDLLRVMLLPSNNVAAEALADFSGRAQFLAAMNAKAQSWGMTNTYYDDPSGLSAGNESTADDLFKLAQHMYMDYPQILAITQMPQATVMNVAVNRPVVIKSINEFAGQPDFLGGKTGYTDQADGNLLSIFSYRGRPILIVVMGINDGVRFDGTQTLYNWFKANFK